MENDEPVGNRTRGDPQSWRKNCRRASLVCFQACGGAAGGDARGALHQRAARKTGLPRRRAGPSFAVPSLLISGAAVTRPRPSHVMLAAVFVIAGVLHFAIPGSYVRIMPPWLPHPRMLVLLSGAFQIAGGLGVLHPRTRRAAGWGLILLLLAVWPANFQMLLNARASGAPAAAQALLVLRLPLQLLLILWVWRSCVRGR